MDYNFTDNDLSILDALLEVYRALYRYYLLQINIDDHCLVFNADIINQLRNKEKELLDLLKLNYPKTIAIMKMMESKIEGDYEETDAIVGVFNDNNDDFCYMRLINSVYFYYHLLSIKDLNESYKDLIHRRRMFNEDEEYVEDDFFEDNLPLEEEYLDDENIDEKEIARERLRRMLDIEEFSYSKDAMILLSYFVDIDAIKHLIVLIDEEVSKTSETDVLAKLNAAKFNIMFFNMTIEDDYINRGCFGLNDAYIYTKALHVNDDILYDLRNRQGVSICGVELENLFYLVDSEYKRFDTKMVALLRYLDLRVGTMFLNDETYYKYDNFVREVLMLYKDKNFDEEKEEEILSQINDSIELSVMSLARYGEASDDAVSLVKDSVIYSDSDRKRFRI